MRFFEGARAAALAIVAVIIAVSGCGDGEDVPGMFAGTWSYELGELDCPTGGFAVDPQPPRSMTVTPAGPSQLTVALDTGCNVAFTLHDHVATAVAGQTCAVDVPVPDAGARPLVVTRWQRSLGGDAYPSSNGDGITPLRAQVLSLTGPLDGALAACPSPMHADGRTVGPKQPLATAP